MERGGLKVRMWGFFAFRRYGRSACDAAKVPRTFTPKIKSNRFIVVCSVPVRLIALALFTRMSTPPNVSAAFAAAAASCSSNLMSTWSGRDFPPACSISRAAVKMVPGSFGFGSTVLAAITTLAPSRAARSAIARPIPRLAPVMKSVFPFNVPMVPPHPFLSACQPYNTMEKTSRHRNRTIPGNGEDRDGAEGARARRAHGVGDGARLHGDVGVLRSHRRGGVGRHDPPCARSRDRPPRHERHLRSRAQRNPRRQGDPGSPGAGRPRDEVRAAPRGGRELEGSERETRVCALRLRGEPCAPRRGRDRPLLPAPRGPRHPHRGNRGRDGGARP